jgi:hypothetical protein
VQPADHGATRNIEVVLEPDGHRHFREGILRLLVGSRKRTYGFGVSWWPAMSPVACARYPSTRCIGARMVIEHMGRAGPWQREGRHGGDQR